MLVYGLPTPHARTEYELKKFFFFLHTKLIVSGVVSGGNLVRKYTICY